MADPIIDDPSTVVDGNWYDTMAGEDAGKIEVLKEFESADAFYDNHQEMVGRNWRTEIAGEDEKFAKTLERFDSPAAFGNSFQEAQQTVRSGNMKDDLPASDADDDSIKAYRESNSLPLEAAGYLENLPEGLVLGEDDAPIADAFMEALHSTYAPPAVAHALIAKYNEFAEQQQDAQNTLDVEQAKETTDSLREGWRGDYRVNINMVGKFLTRAFGAEVKDQLLNGRFQDGRAFMNDAKILEGLASMERIIDPLSVILDNKGDPAQTLNDEIADIEKFMSEHRTAYNKDEVKQARLRQLYGLRIEHDKQTAA